jgi:GDPmannose 4,6-dehydratase
MWQMLQAPEPDDYVIATGVAYRVRDFVAAAFGHAGLDWERHVRHDPRYERPTEVDALVGDASLAAARIGWRPRVVAPELARLMVDADLRQLADERAGRLIRIDR